MKSKFKDEINTIEGKREEAAKTVKELEKATGRIATAKLGRPQASWVKKLRILIEETSATKPLRRKQNCTNSLLLKW